MLVFEVNFFPRIDRDDVLTTRTLCKDSQHQDIRSGEQRHNNSGWMAEVFIHTVHSDLQSSRQSEPKEESTKQRVTSQRQRQRQRQKDCFEQGVFDRCWLLHAVEWICGRRDDR